MLKSTVFCFIFLFLEQDFALVFVSQCKRQEGGNLSTVLSVPQRVCSPSRHCTGPLIVPGYRTEWIFVVHKEECSTDS